MGTLSVEFQAFAIEATPGESYFGRNSYVEFIPGELPVVLSMPHGGYLEPEEIPNRTGWDGGKDRMTLELGLSIREALQARTGSYPHVIINHLHKKKLQPNHEIVGAAEGNPAAERAWWEFQTFIDEAVLSVQDDHGDGLYIDLHGHGHEIQRLELGYMLSSQDLENSDEILSATSYINKSSFRELALRPGKDFADLIRGPHSLGSLFEALGVSAVPSRLQPDPGGHLYYSGGYLTGQHGSRDGGTVSGVQIECHYPGIRDTSQYREALYAISSKGQVFSGERE